MNTQKHKLLKADRDRILISAIKRARNAMMLLQGTKVMIGRKAGFIDFEKEVLILTDALQVLGVDTPSPVMNPVTRPDVVVFARDRWPIRSKPC